MSLKSLKDRQGPGSFNTKGVSTGSVEVDFSSASSPGRGFFWNKLHICLKIRLVGEGPCFKRL